ncbi:putative Hybrid PKS-NRPS biosynthetic cluster [Metarhizium acridum]|nr:putative Hybrid PKS-NRPS biosynthetic cluster [Metarhizium acridum]
MALFSNDMCLLSGVAGKFGRSRGINCLESVFPLTKSQEGMWIAYLADSSSTKYNLTLEWNLKDSPPGEADITNVLGVIDVLTRAHTCLRSTIDTIEGKAHVYVHGENDAHPQVLVVYRKGSAVSETSLRSILRHSFDLRNEFSALWVILQDSVNFRVYLVAHHIILDGQSMSLLSKQFYALLQNEKADFDTGAKFSSMHMMEKAWFGSEACEKSRQTLLSQVSNKHNFSWPKELSLPQSSERQDYRKIDSWLTISKSELAQWSNCYSTSWFRVAVSLIGLLVADITHPPFGHDEVVSVAFGSRPKEMDSCIGQFANALPVKIPLWECLGADASQTAFKSLVSVVGKNISAVKKAELFPATELARTCRNLNMDYEPPKVTVTYSPKLAEPSCLLFPVEGPWDLFFCFLEYEDHVKLGVIYNPLVFSVKAMAEMKAKMVNLIQLSKSQNTALKEMIPWLPSYPRLPLQPSMADKGRPLKHIHQWFEAHAKSRPDSIALSSDELGLQMTYGELQQSAEEKAMSLIREGVGKECKVILSLQRGFAVIEWILAVLKAGAAFVYVDPNLEPQKSAVVASCKPTLIVDDETADHLIAENANHIRVENESGMETGEMDATLKLPKDDTSDDDLAYIIYTSGSTGKPKGAMLEHGNVAAYVKAATTTYECGYGARVLQLASFLFDASILEWTTALCTGATLCFAEHPAHLVGEYLADVIERNNVSFLEITPTALSTLPLNRELPSLRQISVGGELPSREVFVQWHSRVNLVNTYGPTETAVAVVLGKIDKTDHISDTLYTGFPIGNNEIYVCSEDFKSILGPNSVGEICIAGPQVSRGYCDLPEVTAKQFAVHASGVRMYRTGDRGLKDSNGQVLVLGRIDREMKVRGFRIAPEEVEQAVLDSDLGVLEVSVQSSEDGLELMAFVAPRNVDVAALQAKLKESLPNYKVPSRFVVAQSLPKNVSGKTDHKAVKARRKELARDSKPETTMAKGVTKQRKNLENLRKPRMENAENMVGQVWKDILHLEKPPVPTVNFFDIGGHSLLVPKLHEKLKATFPSTHIRLLDLFHQSTIQQQAQLVGDGALGKSEPGLPPSPMSSGKFTPPSEEMPLLENDIAIVGMAGRFPGAASVDEFFEKLMNGYSGISPSNVQKETLEGNIWVNRAGALQDIEDFDHEFWNLSEEDATDMDPQQRLFLEVAYEALADAGIIPGNIDSGRTGVFIGSANQNYHLYTEGVVADSFLRENRGFVAPSISARTAYHLDLRGPNVTVQTNCASSTVALSLAFDAIRSGRCDTALVGGVSVQLYDGGYVTKHGQIFSPRGECNPFDSRADGTVPGDAVVAVVLKKAANHDTQPWSAYANLLGTGIGADGACEKAGYQVPSPRGQAEVIKTAWAVAGITPARLKYAEIHGSGTPVGDALELEGLSLAVQEAGGAQAPFVVGSTKGNIGNTQHASGLVSLVKLCKSIQAGTVPPMKGLSEPNPMIDRNLPLRFATEPTVLEHGDILAVSAAGWGGINSHLLLAFPDPSHRKEKTNHVASMTWRRKTLAAPRLSQPRSAGRSDREEMMIESFIRHASNILGCSVESHTRLKEHGLDSIKYIALSTAVANDLQTAPVSIRGFMDDNCSPSTLASLHSTTSTK